jgi:hypothetical protein
LQVHLGQGVWLAKREYDRVMNVATTPSLLVRNLGVAVYGEDVLKCSSVLGKPCMRFSDRASRPPLSPTRYTAIRGKKYSYGRHNTKKKILIY